MKQTNALFLLFVWLPLLCLGQGLVQKEQTAVQALGSLRKATSDSEINRLHQQFKLAMSDLVRTKGFFDFTLQELKIADIKSADQTVRLLTWNVELSDLSYTYGGFVLRREEGKERVLSLELNDALDPYNTKPENTIDHKSWYGALYYKIIDFSFQGKTQYLLFGYDGGTSMSNFKILDVLSFSGQTARFGSPVFKDAKSIKKRVVFEYANMASMSLEFEPKRARIVFDHLSAEAPALDGIASYYFPDMSYDAYVYDFDRELWQLQTDVIATNPEEVGERYFYALNQKTGKVEKNRMRAEWMNPSDKDNPANGTHSAALPETQTDLSIPTSKKKHPKRRFFGKPKNPESY